MEGPTVAEEGLRKEIRELQAQIEALRSTSPM